MKDERGKKWEKREWRSAKTNERGENEEEKTKDERRCQDS